jgi:hypothetical protein
MFTKRVMHIEIKGIRQIREIYIITLRRKAEGFLMPDEHLIANDLGAASYLSKVTIETPKCVPVEIRNLLETEAARTAREEPNEVVATEMPIVALYRGGNTTFSMAIDKGGDELALAETTACGRLWAWWFDERSFLWVVQNHTILQKLPLNPEMKKAFDKIVSAVSVLKLLNEQEDKTGD